jgi:hypothetical protein
MVELPRDVDEPIAQRVEQMTATFNVCVCRFGVSLYSSMASMPLSRFTPHPIRG